MNAIGQMLDYLGDSANWTGPRGLGRLLANHVAVSGGAVVIATALAVPAGLATGRARRGGSAMVSAANIGRALPSFAVLVLAFGVFSQSGRGLSYWPTLVALVVLAIPPILTNSHTGLRGVDPLVRDAARGMGMPTRSVLRRVELPLALPLVLAGIRTSATQVVATATLGAWVGFACLGTPIFEGFAQQDSGKILGGAVLVSILTILTDALMAIVTRRTSVWKAGF
jgi:ABC-type proline/glycine betaine transport system permease subunit